MPPSIANLLELSTPTPENTPVQAYAKLEFGAYSFYVQSLSVTLGRKAAENDHVDVHLGNTKAISRQHARVQYSFARNCFEIYVGGRNGLFVDDIFYDQGSVVPLDDRTQVQIGEIKFNFLLPHQGTLPEDTPVEEEKEPSETASSPLSSLTPTPPPETDPGPPAEKPDIPYATLIAQSLLSHPRRRRTLQEIYAWIQDHHAYFKGKNKSWQSSIRHNLMSSPAFVLYGPRPGDIETSDKKSKRGKDEWGISPEYEGLIGDLSAKEGDAEKISTKLNKKKPAPPPPTPKPTKQTSTPAPVTVSKPTAAAAPPARRESSTTTSPAPAPTQAEDKNKLEELVKNMQGKGVDMGALLQEALAKMKGMPGLPLKSPQPQQSQSQPPPKRVKQTPFPQQTQPKIPANSTFPAQGVIPQTKTTNKVVQQPIHMPMPLPYTAAKMAPIPMAGATQVKFETSNQAPFPPLSSTLQNPLLSRISPPVQNSIPPVSVPMVSTSGSGGSHSTVSPEPSTAQPNGTTPQPTPPVPSAQLPIPKPPIQEKKEEVLKVEAVKEQVAEVKMEPAKPLETAASKRSPRGKKRALGE